VNEGPEKKKRKMEKLRSHPQEKKKKKQEREAVPLSWGPRRANGGKRFQNMQPG
jgi:hypothetical protein